MTPAQARVEAELRELAGLGLLKRRRGRWVVTRQGRRYGLGATIHEDRRMLGEGEPWLYRKLVHRKGVWL